MSLYITVARGGGLIDQRKETGMTRRLRFGSVGCGVVVALLGLLGAVPAAAQDRHTVMVTNLVPQGGANDGFGKKLAGELRELINESVLHRAIEENDIRDALRQYKLDVKDLDCVTTLQLLVARVARIGFCGSYTEDREAKTVSVQGAQFVAPGTAPVKIADRTWPRDGYRAAAQEIATFFEQFVTQIVNAQYCREYYEAERLEDAESRCVIALNLAPDDVPVLITYAQVLRRTDRPEQAFEQTSKALELNPADETALELAGYLAAKLDMPDESGDYFRQLLQLDPGNAPVRLNIAYNLAQDGEPELAMTLVQDGLDIAPDDVQLLLHHASFAIRSGQDRKVEGQPLTPEAAGYYQKGLDSYRAAYEQLGAEMDGDHLALMVAGLNEVEQPEEALAVAEQALETHGDEPRFWSMKGDILRRLDRTDEALTALDEVMARDPEYRNIRVRQGKWLLEAGREEEALVTLREAVGRGEQPARTIASMFFGEAVRNGIQPTPKRPAFAIRLIGMAKQFEDQIADSKFLGQVDYFLAYSMYVQAEAEQKPETVASARQTLPRFREVKRILELSHVAEYGRGNRSTHYQQLKSGTDTFIEIQEALIRRGS